jgi:NAD-dependent dihydropyrimidine dehydrogenase PreA subunit/nitroreductase
MPIPTSRTNETATLTIDQNKCNACGVCVEICKDFSLYIENDKLLVSKTPLFGCIGCGQCAAVCPTGAIIVEGRTLSLDDFIKQPLKQERANYDTFLNLLVSRRSVRDYKDKEIPDEIIQNILNAAVTAPMGLPPSDVGVLIFKGREKVREFSFDFIEALKKMKKFFSPFMLAIMKPFLKRADYELTKSFIVPLIDFFEKSKESKKNYLLYDAPLAVYFYNSGYADPADPYITATYAMLAAHSLGLGCCMIGSIAPFLKHMKGFKEKHNIPENSKDGIFLIFGYPKYKYQKAIKRSFAKIEYA